VKPGGADCDDDDDDDDTFLFVHAVQGMWAWFQRPVQSAHAHPNHPQSAAEVQVSGKGLQRCVPQPVTAQWSSQENPQERLEVYVSL